MPWGTLKDQWERRTALKIAVRQTLSPQMSVRQTWTVDWFANMFANLSTAHDHWFSTARPLRLRPTPWGTRKVILRPPRISAVNCPQTARTVDVCVMWPGLKMGQSHQYKYNYIHIIQLSTNWSLDCIFHNNVVSQLEKQKRLELQVNNWVRWLISTVASVLWK